MQYPRTGHTTIGLVLTTFWLTACNGDADPIAVDLRFEALLNGTPVTMDETYEGLGTNASDFTPELIWMYVSNLALIDEGGEEVPVTLDEDGQFQALGTGMLAFEAPNSEDLSNTKLTGSVPAGNYQGLSFDLGLPPELNHGNLASLPAPLNFTEMSWGWIAGHKFLRLDADTSGVPGWRLHLGSTGCSGDPGSEILCQYPNIPRVRLEGLAPEQGLVVIDLNALLAQANLDVDLGGSAGCMAESTDPDCPPLMNALGLDEDGLPGASPGFMELRQ